MNPQSPKTCAPCTLPKEPSGAVAPNQAVGMATNEVPPPVANTESAPMMIREQDRLMPVANVSRIMRQVLPPYAKISDDAKEVIQECVSEFISFVTGEANERCHSERRKTVTPEDIVWAMNRLGFDDYVAPLGVFLRRMREADGGEERGPGRGSRRGSSVLALSPPNGSAQHQMHHRPAPAAVCRQHPLQGVSPAGYGYAAVPPVPRPVPASASAAAMHFVGGRSYYQMYGGDRRPAVVHPCYGGGAAAFVQAADEASSSTESPPAGRPGPQ